MSFPYKIKRRESTFAFPALVVFTQKKDYSQSLSLSVLNIELDLLPASSSLSASGTFLASVLMESEPAKIVFLLLETLDCC